MTPRRIPLGRLASRVLVVALVVAAGAGRQHVVVAGDGPAAGSAVRLTESMEGEQPLCPPGTYARDHWPERSPSYRDVFQTIEGGMGFWVSTQFGSATPKFRMNGTANCYSDEISSPGWGFGVPEPLATEKMGLVQVSNRVLVPPDGLTFEHGMNGELFGTFSKVQPHLTELRELLKAPTAMAHMEKVVMSIPDAEARLETIRNRLKAIAVAHAAKG